MPAAGSIDLTVEPLDLPREFGPLLHTDADGASGYQLRFVTGHGGRSAPSLPAPFPPTWFWTGRAGRPSIR